MTPEQHQIERMRAWVAFYAHGNGDALVADKMLAEFDARFPAPEAEAPKAKYSGPCIGGPHDGWHFDNAPDRSFDHYEGSVGLGVDHDVGGKWIWRPAQ